MAGVAIATFIGSTLFQTREAKKREKRTRRAQEEASKVEAANRANEARRARRAQIREARRRRAEIENVAGVTGQAGSSAAVAAQGSVQASLGSNIGDIQTALAEGSALSAAEQNVFDADKKSGLERAAGIGSSISGRFI